jgi:hypothetical protein
MISAECCATLSSRSMLYICVQNVCCVVRNCIVVDAQVFVCTSPHKALRVLQCSLNNL